MTQTKNKNELISPIVVFVYDRPDRAKMVIESIGKCKLAKESELFVFSDGPKNEKSVPKVRDVRSTIHDPAISDQFRKVTIVEAEQNKGLARSVIEGVTRVIEEFGRVIVVEDDNTVTSDFLEFMNGALTFYEKNMRIGRIGGYSVPIEKPADYPYDVYACRRGSSYAWATWKNRWDLVDWNVSDYPQFAKDKSLRRKFNKYGQDMSDMLTAQMEGRINSWAIRYSYAMFKQNMTTIMPIHSRVKNNGDDGTGQNIAKGDTRWNTVAEELDRKIEFADVEEREDITSQYIKKFRKPLVVRLKGKVKKLLRRS